MSAVDVGCFLSVFVVVSVIVFFVCLYFEDNPSYAFGSLGKYEVSVKWSFRVLITSAWSLIGFCLYQVGIRGLI